MIKTVIVGSVFDNLENKDSVLTVKSDVAIGDKVKINNIFFDAGRDIILAESFPELLKLARYLVTHPELEISINGHSDNTGSQRKNMKLSENRARAVFIYLITKGVQNRMVFKGFGDTQPIADNATDAGKAQNRRVEFEIIGIKKK